MAARNPRTANLLAKAGSNNANIRLTKADREFLRDLSRAQLIDEETASKVHYSARKHGARTLSRLEKAGIIERLVIGAPKGQKPITAWQFASRSVARAWGGNTPGFGSNRSAYHELLSGRAYFELGRPESFRAANQFTAEDRALFGGTEPDAMMRTSDGEVVFIEADSGHYTKRQIMEKQAAWSGVRQFWIQPQKAMARVPLSDTVSVARV